MTPFSTSLALYLTVVLAVALVATLAALGTATEVVLRNRRVRLAHHQTVRSYYGARLALHH